MSEIINNDFQKLENPTEVEEIAAPASPIKEPTSFESIEEKPPFEDLAPSKLDKVADFIGAYAATIILTFIAAVGIAFAITVIPIIVFSFGLIIRCWAGIWSLMLIRGALKNKTV